VDPNPQVILQEWTRFLAEFQKYYAVQVAFWIKEPDHEEWNLYIAASDITDDNFDVAYEKVLDITRDLGNPLFDPFQVKLLTMDDPLTKAALELRRRMPSQTIIRWQGGTFDGISVEWVFVYPLPVSATVA
jgi:hypothetical protein